MQIYENLPFFQIRPHHQNTTTKIHINNQQHTQPLHIQLRMTLYFFIVKTFLLYIQIYYYLFLKVLTTYYQTFKSKNKLLFNFAIK